MKNFFLRIFLFCIPIIIIAIGCEIYVRNMPSFYRQKRDQLVANADSIEVLILGSSHAADGVDPNQFTLYAHNLAFGSQYIYFDRKLVEKYLPDLPRLKYVLLDFDYNSLYRDHAIETDFFYKYYYGINYRDRNFYKESFLQSYFVYSPGLALSMMLNSLKGGAQNAEWIKGWRNDAGRNDKIVMSAEKNKLRAEIMDGIVKIWQGGDFVLNEFNDFINFLLSKGITPILVSYPNYSLLKSLLDKSVIERNLRIGNELSQKYQIPFLDFFNDDSFTVSDFVNCDHLNGEGAAKLSKKINEVIMNLEEKKHEK